MISDFFQILDRKQRWAYILSYTAMGFLLGLILLVSAWIAELKSSGVDWTFESVRLAHQRNIPLWFVDAAPIIAALFFGVIGRIQAKLKISNLELENRVRERMVELTMEKARSNAILDTAADGIINFDEAGKILVYNNAAERLFGFERAEITDENVRTLIPMLQEYRGARHFSRLVNLQKPDLDFLTGEKEFEALRKDGSTIPVELDVSRFTVGEEVLYTAIVRDITERRRVQAMERTMQKITQTLNEAQDLPTLYEQIHRSLSQVIEATNLQIALATPGTNTFKTSYEVDQFNTPVDVLDAVESSVLNLVARDGKALLLDQEKYGALVAQGTISPLPHSPTSWLGVPLISMGRTIGVIAVQSFKEGFNYKERDLMLLNLVSSQIAAAIERERAREALRNSERRYRRMIEEAGDIVYTVDLMGNFTYMNPQVIKLTGYEEKELIGERFSKLVDPEWVKRVGQFYRQQRETKLRESEMEFPIVTKDKRTRWIEQKTTLIMDQEEVTGFQAIVHDITERRQAEAALREREERFRSLSASSPIGVFQLDAKANCIYTNRSFQEITGRSYEGTLGAGWIDCIHPEERETFRTEWIFARFDTASAVSEVRVQRPSGAVRWVNIRWAPTYGEEGVLTGFVGTFQDVTEQKRMERVNQVLYEISEAQQSTSDLQEFLAVLQDALGTIIDTTNFYVALHDDQKKTISFPYARENEEIMNLRERPVGKGLTGIVLRTGKPLLLDEQGILRIYNSGEAELLGKLAKNWLGVPLVSNGKVVGAVVLQSYTDSERFTDNELQMMNFVSSQIAAAVERKQVEDDARRAARELADAHNRIKEDLRIAAKIQKARLPREAPVVPRMEFDWFFDSCDEVAGDMFNFIKLDENRLGIYILDVSGHGIPAALLSMSLSRSLTAATDGSGALMRMNGNGLEIASPARAAEIMNDRYQMSTDTNQYFTMIYGVLDKESMQYRFIRAGHPPLVVVRANGQAEAISRTCGPAVGILPSVRYEEDVVQLEPGDHIILFTDGVDESTNLAGEEFGVERIVKALSPSRPTTVAESVRLLRESLEQFSTGMPQADDITIVGFGIRSEVPALL
ncbi:PAS domain S-box protein [Candidatus Sumerlaeota bacterium]|nr:PAS domain S-box protein [Candidatus Sumerlaeota bacterium]